ncbi:hypothetical protein [Endozoicomonas sp. ALC066]|uniref:hypothetical protein n=1 Tax=Endozoicomonas sp. ALC066 TaxID=3403078 RepID=UPI003BB5C1F7
MDSRLRGNDVNEAGNDVNEARNVGSQLVPTLESVLRHPLRAIDLQPLGRIAGADND